MRRQPFRFGNRRTKNQLQTGRRIKWNWPRLTAIHIDKNLLILRFSQMRDSIVIVLVETFVVLFVENCTAIGPIEFLIDHSQ